MTTAPASGSEHQVTTGLKRVAVLCLLTCGDEVLLLRREREPNRGTYVPIGGKVDPFEAPREAAWREVREEAGLTLPSPGALRFCGVLTETSPTEYNWVSFVYAAEVLAFDPPPCKEGRLEWIERSRLTEISTPATDLAIYERALAGQTFVLDAQWSATLELLTMRDELSGLSAL